LISISEYFTQLTGYNPIDEQVDLLTFLVDDKVKNCMVSCGRGFSKTLCSSVALLWYAEKSLEEGKPIKLMIVSPQQTMYEYVCDMFSKTGMKEHLVQHGVYRDIPVDGFELKNGTKVFTKPATAKVRSSRADILFIDECADVPEDVIKSAMSCLAGDINRIILISTCHKQGYFTERAVEPEKFGYVMKQFSSEVVPWMKQSVARAKKELTDAEYAMDVLGRPPTKEERGLFAGKHIEKCIVDGEVGRLALPNSVVEIGIDWGFDPCATALVVREKTNTKSVVLFCKTWKRKPIEDIAPEIGKIINSFSPCTVKADAKPEHYKGKIEKYTKTRIHYIYAPEHKAMMDEQLVRIVREHRLTVSSSQKDLIIQMRKAKKNKRTGMDLVDALALACYEPSVPFSKQVKPNVTIITLKEQW